MQCCAVCCTEQYQAQFRWHSESVPPAVIEASVQCPVSKNPPIKAGGFQGSPAVVIDPQRTMLEHNRINGSLWSLYERLSHQPSVGNNLVYQLDERQLLFMWTSKPPMCRFGNFIPHKTTRVFFPFSLRNEASSPLVSVMVSDKSQRPCLFVDATTLEMPPKVVNGFKSVSEEMWEQCSHIVTSYQ